MRGIQAFAQILLNGPRASPATPKARDSARRAGTGPGPACPPSARTAVDLAALQRLWDAVGYEPHPLHGLVEVALSRPRLASTSASPEAVRLITSELRPLAKLLPELEGAMVTGNMTAGDYAAVGALLDNLAAQWHALPDNRPDPPPTLNPAC